MRPAPLAVLVLQGLLLAQGPAEAWTPLSESALRSALHELALDGLDVVRVADELVADRLATASPARRPQLLIGQDSLVLRRIEARGLLAAPPEMAWHDPYVLVAGPKRGAAEALPKTPEELLFDTTLHREYVLPKAESAEALWAGFVAQMLRSGRDEEYAFAWLRTLEAHALEEAASEADALELLRDGRAAFALVARSALLTWLRVEGAHGLRQIAPFGPLPRRAVGFAVASGTEVKGTVEQALVALRSPRGHEAIAKACSLHVALGSGAESRAASLPDPDGEIAREPDASRWLSRWTGEERGKGRTIVSVETALDVLFCAAFAAFLIYAYRRLGRSEAKEPQNG